MSHSVSSTPTLSSSKHDNLDDLLARLEAEWQTPSVAAAATPPPTEPPPVMPAPEPAQAPSYESERRGARRRSAEEFGRDLRITLPGAAEARPVNVSATGVLTETTHRLCPGRIVDLFLRINGVRRVMRARVVRCFVHAVTPRPLFRAALQFEDPCRLPECDE